MVTDIEEIKKELKELLSEKRYYHCIGTMKEAEKLAKLYQVDTQKAILAGLTHDIAKEMPTEKLLEYAGKNNILVDEVELKQPFLLHSRIGADICKKKYNFSDDIIQAIDLHTTGDKEMTILDKIIFLADKTEETRTSENTNQIRKLAKQNIEEAILLYVNCSLKEMIDKQKLIHPKTIALRNELLNK